LCRETLFDTLLVAGCNCRMEKMVVILLLEPHVIMPHLLMKTSSLWWWRMNQRIVFLVGRRTVWVSK